MSLLRNSATELLTRLHDEACERGEHFYRDPQTGYVVFTRLKHLERGYCCGSGCRHCPYSSTEGTDEDA